MNDPGLATRRRLRTSGGEMAYTDVGEGPPVLLLHTVPLWSFQWRQYVPMLAPRHRVIAPDLIGAGDSDMPEDRGLGLRAQSGYVRELLDHLGIERYAVVGHGIGGGIAQLLALEGDGVEAMVLIDVAAFDHWPSGSARELQERAPDVEPTAALASALVGAAFDVAMRHRTKLTDDLTIAYTRPYAEDPAALFRIVCALDGAGLTGREAEFEALAMPVLILWGEDDPFFPATVAEELNAAIPSSTLGLLPGCGHYLTEEVVETLGPLITEYLRAMYLRAPHGHAGEKEGVVMLQLERRPPWVDLADDEADDWFVDDDEDDEEETT
jgi:pimeloyl-ACP methyl ester carboxylesterase